MSMAEEWKQKQHRQWMNQNAHKTFDWLGGRWTDAPLLKKRFENFDSDKQTEAYRAARSFVELPEGTLVLHGTFGCGKTHLLAAICNELHEREVMSRFCTAPALFGAIQGCINAHEDYTRLLNEARWAPVFVLDDVDKARWSEFREEIYFDILDARVKHELPTALSTNALSDLGSFVGGACLSRLSIGQLAIEMKGEDYRKQL